jgi:hypothetical protein
MINAGCWCIAIDASPTIAGKDGSTRERDCVTIRNSDVLRESNYGRKRYCATWMLQHQFRILNCDSPIIEDENERASI